MLGIIGGLRGALSAIGAAAVVYLGITAHHAVFVHPSLVRAAVAEGQAIEKRAWEKSQRILLEAMALERRGAQLRIDHAEKLYLESQSKAAQQILALEEIIVAEQESENEAANPSCPVRPALSRRLRDQLDAIGK